eukprot:COSAG06_NODE_148_length_22056_cov_75.881239_1_plen_402_part_00
MPAARQYATLLAADVPAGMPPRRKGVKLAVVGESAGGKTTLLTRLLHATFADGRHKPTDGCYRHNTAVKLDDGRKLPLQLWDTPGKASFQDISQNFEPSPINGVDGLIIVYDASSSRSVSSLKKWVKAVRKAAPPGCRGVLIGTKLDRVPGGKVPPCRTKAVALAKANGMRHAEVSAADEDSVGDAVGKFLDLVVGIDAKRKQQQQQKERERELLANVPSGKMVEVWLEHEGLGDYAEAFAAAGYKGPGCLAELQALPRPKLLLLCKRVNGELRTPRPEGEEPEPPPAGEPPAAPAPAAQVGTSRIDDASAASDSAAEAAAKEPPEAASEGRAQSSSIATSEAEAELESTVDATLSVPEFLASRGLGVYAPLFASAGYSGAGCAAELAELVCKRLFRAILY